MNVCDKGFLPIESVSGEAAAAASFTSLPEVRKTKKEKEKKGLFFFSSLMLCSEGRESWFLVLAAMD